MMCGEIWWVDFGEPFGSEPAFRHSALVIQSDFLNESRINTTIVLPITSNLILADYQGNTFLSKLDSGLPKDSVIVGAQAVVVDKVRFIEKAGQISKPFLYDVLEEFNSILG